MKRSNPIAQIIPKMRENPFVQCSPAGQRASADAAGAAQKVTAGGGQAAQKDAKQRRQIQDTASLFSAIVESSDDAIISKTLAGIITSWNKSAERLFGYSADEAIGQPITILIPPDRLEEEPRIIKRIEVGERVDHFETIRRRKDGSLLDISLTISPIRNDEGMIVGASKIARDITDSKRGQEKQLLLLREMNHRVKNLFALATGLVTLSARSAETPEALAAAIRERLSALARAHDLTLPSLQADEVKPNRETTLTALLKTILAPFQTEGRLILIDGCDAAVGESSLTSLALLLHEFATNSAKYGALSSLKGKLHVHLAAADQDIHVIWTESDGPPLPEKAGPEGFGSRLARATVQGHLQGTIDHEWKQEGLVIKLRVPMERLGA
ncbi:PAS domain S-box protein [Methyloferula stellata]|uniref:PAS domain S-box protein n=1 Tax=Methyloferula stellata TaxID=876270 RepID=UPI001FCBEA0E|nr:PAS domain S-box protein [Methyloferula stellata]